MLNLDKLKKSEQVTLSGHITLTDISGRPYAMPGANGQPGNAGISFTFNGGKFSCKLPFSVAQELSDAIDRTETLHFSEVVAECSPKSTKEGVVFKGGLIHRLMVGKDIVYEDKLAAFEQPPQKPSKTA